MSEIEKLYKTAGVKKEIIPCPAKYYGYNCTRNNWDDTDCSCNIEGYPPFAAEKQLAIIKWLLESYDIGFSQLGQRIDTSLDGVNCISGLGSGDTFEESLAQAINDLLQDLAPEEKQQVKGILE